LPLELSTHYLAASLANTAIQHVLKMTRRIDEKREIEFTQLGVLVAGKMCERDINIPTVPDIMIAGGKKQNNFSLEYCFNERKLKAYEIDFCRYFDWNVKQTTFYDLVTEFLINGCFEEDDFIDIEKIEKFEGDYVNIRDEDEEMKLIR